MRLHAVDFGHRLEHCLFERGRQVVGLVERERAGKLQMKRELGPIADPEERNIVDLAHARNMECRSEGALRAAEGAG